MKLAEYQNTVLTALNLVSYTSFMEYNHPRQWRILLENFVVPFTCKFSSIEQSPHIPSEMVIRRLLIFPLANCKKVTLLMNGHKAKTPLFLLALESSRELQPVVVKCCRKIYSYTFYFKYGCCKYNSKNRLCLD